MYNGTDGSHKRKIRLSFKLVLADDIEILELDGMIVLVCSRRYLLTLLSNKGEYLGHVYIAGLRPTQASLDGDVMWLAGLTVGKNKALVAEFNVSDIYTALNRTLYPEIHALRWGNRYWEMSMSTHGTKLALSAWRKYGTRGKTTVYNVGKSEMVMKQVSTYTKHTSALRLPVHVHHDNLGRLYVADASHKEVFYYDDMDEKFHVLIEPNLKSKIRMTSMSWAPYNLAIRGNRLAVLMKGRSNIFHAGVIIYTIL